MRHFFLIDEFNKLNINKDSSLYLAARFSHTREVYVFFKEDFQISNIEGRNKITVRSFNAKFKDDGYYLQSVDLTETHSISLTSKDCIHMRLDPPYDENYHRALWKLNFVSEQSGCKVFNNPIGIMSINEKLSAFLLSDAIPSIVFPTKTKLKEEITSAYLMKKNCSFIVKPLNSFSGFGVFKFDISSSDNETSFQSKLNEFLKKIDYEDIIFQPFISEVKDGEIRTVFLGDKHLGSIIKTPQKGEFLSNIAQGASFESILPNQNILNKCKNIAEDLNRKGIYLIAFDVLLESITEINVTCPGLMVELDFANQKDTSEDVLNFIENL